MAYLQSVHSQILLCLRSVGFGFLLGLSYETIRFLRLLLFAKRSSVPWDTAFGALAGLGTFLFALAYDDGRLRAYVLLALAAGFAVCYSFCAVSLRRRLDRALLFLHRVSSCAADPIGKIERRIAGFPAAARNKMQKSLKKFQKNEKSS